MMKKITTSALQDSDGDKIKDSEDNCPTIANPDQPAIINFISLDATSTSVLPVTFVLEHGNADVLNSTLQINGAGYISITAYQEGNINFLPAEPVKRFA
jgi:hypothetical protein